MVKVNFLKNVGFIVKKSKYEINFTKLEYYSNRDVFLFPTRISSVSKIKNIRRKRVIDTSKILRIIDEIEENLQFKYIIKQK